MELGNFNFKQDTSSHEQVVIRERRTVASLQDEEIVGRVSEKEKIMDLLQREDEPFVIPVHGLGGLGKTTLVRMVYNDSQTEKAFDVRAWIYVSTKFDLEAIGKCIISQLDGKSYRVHADLQSVHNHVKDILTGKRFLIVLDDIWEKDQEMLVQIISLLKGGKPGSKVIVTTRNKKVAKIMNANLQIELKPLPDSDCWTLFQNIALEPGTVGSCFEDIGEVIVQKCKGMPIAVKSLASILRGSEFKVWESVRDSSIWLEDATSSDANKVLPSLKLSYYYMPIHLRLCFAYCSVIPKGCHIEKNSLIQQWIALGFVQSTSNAKVEDCAESYFNELLEMSFFHLSSTPSKIAARHPNKPPREFIMHDMVHALATFVAGDEVSILNVPMKRNYHAEMDCCRYALVEKHVPGTIDPSILQKIVPGRARALHFNAFNLMKLPSHTFTFSKFLRVLDLSSCTLAEFPTSISKLRQLKYLCAKRMQIQELPKSLSGLQNLQALMLIDCISLLKLPSYFSGLLKLHYLELHGCSGLLELTEGIGNLTGLQHIDLSGCSSLPELPSTIGRLKNLSCLNLSNCSKLRSLPQSFGELTSLEDLNLSNCCELSSLPAEFVRKIQRLRFLDLSSCTKIKSLPEFCTDNSMLEILDLSACHNLFFLPASIGHLRALKRLDLSNCSDLTRLLPLGQHHALQFLNLSGCYQVRRILDFLAHSTLNNLEYLNLSRVGKALVRESTKWTGSVSRDILQMPSSSHGDQIHIEAQLNKLIEGMPRLKYLSIDGFTLFSEQRIASVKGLLTLPDFDVNERYDPMEGRWCSNIIVLDQILDLTHSRLNIRNLERLYHRKDARKARLAEKHQLRSLSLMWTVPKYYNLMQFQEDNTHAALVLEELRPPQKIEEFRMEGYMAATFPSWLMNIGSALPHVVNLTLCRLARCTSLPPLGQLQKLKVLHLSYIHSVQKVDLDVYGSTARPFPMLRELKLNDMEMLEEWMTEDVMFPILEHLEVESCPCLKFKPYIPMRSRYSIRNCRYIFSGEGVTMGPPCTSSSSTSVMNVTTSDSDSDTDWSGLQHLVNLEIMTIHDSYCLRSLPDGIRGLRHLKKLEITRCSSFVMLPSCIGDLATLEELVVHDCGRLATLPESMQRLGHLQKLVITDGWCRTNYSFAELPEWLGDLASLWELKLDNSCLSGRSLQTWDISRCTREVQTRFCLGEDTTIINRIPFISVHEKDIFFVHSTRKHGNIIGITEPHSVGGSISSIVLLQRISRVTSSNLSIFSLENVSSPEEAAKADIAKISNLHALRLHWSVNSDCAVEGPKVQDEAVLANLQPPRDLVVLDIDGYRGSVFRGWLSDASTLPCIREITLSSLSRCRHLPLLGLLPNLELLQIAGMPELTKVAGQPFKKLRELVLARFENLEEWSTEISSDDGQVMDIPMFPNLEYLEIKSCHKLRFSPSFPASKKYLIHNSNKVLSFQGVLGISPTSSSEMEIHNCHFSPDDLRGFHYLSNLEELTISNCSALTTSPGSITGLHSLKKLHVLQCQDFATLPGCFGTLSSLQELTISKCSTLTTLPESIAGLHSLKKLHVFRCHNFTTLPECFGHLSSLQEARIDSSAKLASLPESLRCTTCLVDLIFWCDDELERQYRSGIDSHKFAHIKNVKINGRYVRLR